MKIEVKHYTYETMPDYNETVEGAKEIVMSGHEIGVELIPDIVYDHKDDTDLHLEILKPSIFLEPDRKFPIVLYVQGSAWMKQNLYLEIAQLSDLARRGYVVAVVEYRHSGIAHFPAQIIDAKNAIRFMKAHAKEYNGDPDKVILTGGSSGGHVATLAGMTAKTNLFDEPINDESIEIKGIIDMFGAVNPLMPYGFPTTLDHQSPTSPEGRMMGFDLNEHKEEALKACSKAYVNEDFPPMLILHGSKDKTVYIEESVELYQELKKAGKDVEFYIVRNSDHGGMGFWTKEAIDIYDAFIKRCLS